MDSVGRMVNEVIERHRNDPHAAYSEIVGKFMAMPGKYGLSVREQEWANEPFRRAEHQRRRKRQRDNPGPKRIDKTEEFIRAMKIRAKVYL